MIQPADRRDADGDELSRLRRRVAELEEQHLNATDAVIGAEAAAAQARRDIEDIFHQLHVREEELKELKGLLGFELDTPLEEIVPALGGGSRPLGRSARRRSVRSKPRR
ncbi:MAG: hypothetical protein OES24_05070 [Acidimicrobiia bacterium]|nr:hypothetical protein [Acidimicrobiia bacterium]